MTTIISTIAHKGGVGKTTITVGLAEALATRNFRVLVADLDPQANASRRLGIAPGGDHATLVEIMDMGRGPVETGLASKVIRPCTWSSPAAARISVLPSRFDLSTREEDAARPGAVRRLKKLLDSEQIRTDYDVILIDTPPSLGHLTQNALVASELALLIAAPEHDAVEGALRSSDFINSYKDDLGNPGLGITGVVVNGYRSGTILHKTYLGALRENFGETLLRQPYLPLRTELANAMSAGVPLSSSAPVMWPQIQQLAENLMEKANG